MCRARTLFVFALLAVAGAACAAPSEPQLVVLGEPQPPAGVESSKGPLTLAYRVVEIFSGEPGSASVIVRHPQLDPMDRVRLGAGERVIVMARPDAQFPGRWVGSAPLRATDEAVAAFRKWGAPADVREATPLSEAIAVAKRSQGEVSRPVEREPATAPATVAPVSEAATKATAKPAAPTKAAPAPAPAPEPTEVEDVDETPAWSSPARETAAPPERETAAPAERETAPAERQARSSTPPLVVGESADPSPGRAIVPARGPGLPPSPTSRVLGPSR